MPDAQINPDDSKIDAEVLRQFGDKDPAQVAREADAAVKQKRWRFHQKWKVVLNMLAGEQWLKYNPRTRVLDRMSDLYDQQQGANALRACSNRLLPAYDLKLGRLTQALHIGESVPAPGRKDAFDLARMESQFLLAMWQLLKLDELDVRLKSHLTAFGCSFLQVEWDAEAVKRNMPSFYVHSPFGVAVAPYGVRCLEDASAIIQTSAVAVEEMRDTYRKAFDRGDDAELKADLEEDYDSLIASSDSFLVQSGSQRSIEGMIALRQTTHRPTPKHPNGYRLITTKHKTLELKPLDRKLLDLDPRNWCPYLLFKFREFPDSLYSEGGIYPGVSDQVQLNKLISDIMTDIHKQGRARRLIRESSGLRPDQFDDSGTDIRWDDDPDEPTMEPVQWDRPPEIKSDYWRLYGLLSQNLDDNLQLHDPSRGKPGSNVQSGAQLASLQAMDDAHLTPVLDMVGRTWQRAFELALTLQSLYQGGPIALAGADPRTGSPFTLADFKMHSDGPIHPMVRVRTVGRSAYDKLQAQENNKLLLQMGALNDMPPEEIRKRFEFGIDASMFEPDNEHRLIARHENKLILSGEAGPAKAPTMVRKFHHHVAHLDEHNRERNSLRYEDAPLEIKRTLDAHCDAHEAILQRAMEGQMAMQNPQTAAPPEPMMAGR